MFSLSIIIALIVIYLIKTIYWKRFSLPPGPLPLPIIGNLYDLFSGPPPGLTPYKKWRKQYGDIFTVWFGSEPLVVITGFKKLKETFIQDGDSYKDKLIFDSFNQTFRGGNYGVIDTNGERWREARRFTLHQLRDFGVGKDRMESSILLEFDKMKEIILKNPKEVDIQSIFDLCVGNIINQFLFCHRFENDSRIFYLKDEIDKFFKLSGSYRVNFALTVTWLPRFITDYLTSDVKECTNNIYKYLEDEIRKHEKEIDFDLEENKDFAEAFLKEKRRREQDGDNESFCYQQLLNVCFDMWIAGMHTTTNTLGFMASYAIRFPEKQKKLQEELSRVIGNREITMRDKLSLPYTNAFINETQRMANLLPNNLIHQTTRPVNLNGYDLPAGTGVLHQISSVLSDEELFPNPDNFEPERYLDKNGDLMKCEELVPFSVGKRVCLGEGLARMELFLFTANLFNQFEFLPSSTGTPSAVVEYSFIVKAKEYKCNIKSRY